MMPSQTSADATMKQVINCIWKHPDASRVYLTCDMLGQEEILVNVSRTFGAKIYVDKAKDPECFKNLELTVPEILCEDPSSRFHLFDGSPRLYERAKAKLVEAKETLQPEPLIVRPSTQWYACEDEFSDVENTIKKRINEAVKDQFGVWHVCYSMHSSKEELEWALQLLAPRWVVSTTPNCRAMELGYVKKHCFKSKVALNSSLWKLLDMTMEASDDIDTLIKSVSRYPVVEGIPKPCAQTESPVKQVTDTKTPVSLPGQSLPVTLFGRARLSLQDDAFSREGCNILPANVLLQSIPSDAGRKFLNTEEDAEAKWERSLARKDFHQVKYQQSEVQETRVDTSASYLNVGPSGMSGSVRKLYRSMNVPVPEPLPSLVNLMKSTKRVRRGID